MPPFADLVHFLARAADNNATDDAYVVAVLTSDDNPDNRNDRHHKRLEIGVIVAIIIAGIAIIGTVVTCIVKQRRRARKRVAKQANLEITWYGAGGEPRKKKGGVKNGSMAIGVALGGEERGATVRPKKVSFAASEGEAPPPSYEVVVTTKDAAE